jgi:hypothetical protein
MYGGPSAATQFCRRVTLRHFRAASGICRESATARRPRSFEWPRIRRDSTPRLTNGRQAVVGQAPSIDLGARQLQRYSGPGASRGCVSNWSEAPSSTRARESDASEGDRRAAVHGAGRGSYLVIPGRAGSAARLARCNHGAFGCRRRAAQMHRRRPCHLHQRQLPIGQPRAADSGQVGQRHCRPAPDPAARRRRFVRLQRTWAADRPERGRHQGQTHRTDHRQVNQAVHSASELLRCSARSGAGNPG